MTLKTLDVLGPLHGYGIAQRLRQISGDVFQVEEGTLYPALQRLLLKGWIEGEWSASENNRRARYYRLTKRGIAQLAEETRNWYRLTSAMNWMLEAER